MKRSMVSTVAVGVLAINSGACEPPSPTERTQDAERAITGGQVETGYPAVGCLRASPSATGCNCSGTLIAPSVVLSAKHCGPMGLFQIGNVWSSATETRNIDQQIAYHPEEGTGPSSSIYAHDLQIFHLQTPIYDVRPLPINTGSVPAKGSTCIAVGFGNNSAGGEGTKYSATVSVSSSGTVGVTVAGIGWVGMDSEIQVVAGSPSASPPGGITQPGDSGGPLLCNGVITGALSGTFTFPFSGTYYTALDSSLTFDSAWVTNAAANFVNEPMVSAVAWSSNRIDLFGRGIDGALYHKAWDSTLPVGSDNSHWYPSMFGWEYRGGFISGTPEAVSWGPNRLDVFVRGGDNNPQTDNDASMSLWHHYWDGSSWNWQNLGGVLAAHPAVVSWAPNRIDVIGVGNDGQMYHLAGDGTSFGGWEAVAGSGGPSSFLGPVKAISVANENFDVYATGVDGLLYSAHHMIVHPQAYEGPVLGYVTLSIEVWTPWLNLGGPILGTPTVTTWGGGREDIFVKGTDNNLYQKVLTSSGWLPSQLGFYALGGPIDGSPAATSMQLNWLTLISNGPDTADADTELYKGWFNGSQWAPTNTTWLNMGGTPAGVPVLLANPGVGVNLFSLGRSYTPTISNYTPTGPSASYGWSGAGSLGGVLSW